MRPGNAKFFSVCNKKHNIQSNCLSEKPVNRGTICEKAFPEVIQPVKGNDCGLIPIRLSFGSRIQDFVFQFISTLFLNIAW